MSNRIATGDVSQERLDELALGKLNPKTSKRKGGFLNSVRTMPQYRDRVIAGEWNEDDLIEQAYNQAWNYLKRTAAKGDEPDTTSELDAEYRDAQEARYREDYEWNGSNDEAQLQQLLDLEVQSRATNREFAKANLNVKDRTSLLSELRNIAKDHAALQKGLGIDRPTRDTRRRSEDPMAALRLQIEAGAEKMQALIDEWAVAATEAKTIDELRALAKHHSGLPFAWIDATLAAHRRVLGIADA